MTVSTSASDAALDALYTAFSTHTLALPQDGRVLFLRAREGGQLRALRRAGWVCEQSFKPFADALERAGLQVRDAEAEPAAESALTFPLVIVLPPRQREEARALFARALRAAGTSGVVVASVPNAEGARSSEADLARLAGGTQSLSKHKCRVFWTTPRSILDVALLAEWAALDAPTPIADGRYLSRPGLFAWNRIDPASALLAEYLPDDLHGRVADLGAGYGYLATEVVRRCAGVGAVDLYEAEARALLPARENLARAIAASARSVAVGVHWHDVSVGLPQRYDAIVTNPPFHLGRADRPELGRAFIDVAADALLPQGQLWLVANRHLAYEATLQARFDEVRTVIVRDGFKVISARARSAASAAPPAAKPAAARPGGR